MKRFVYADHSATTRISESVMEAMLPYLKENYGNASSIYGLAGISEMALNRARSQVAKALHAQPEEIFSATWTVGGIRARVAEEALSAHIFVGRSEALRHDDM